MEQDALDSWSRLPEDVVLRVLTRLPIPHLFRARTVCKQWNALTSTPEFLAMCSARHTPYFPVVISRRFYMGDLGICILGNDSQGGNDLFRVFFGYNHEAQAWQKLPPLDFLPHEARIPVASAGGLICFRGTSTLFLCNPVARTFLELPAITYKWPPSVSVHILVDNSAYKVIIVGKIRHNFVSDSFRSIAIYESTTKAWRVVDAQHPAKVFSYGPTAAICGNSIYCEAICHCGQLGVMNYDVQSETWNQTLHEIPSDDRGEYQLTQVVECGGAIYMVLARGFGGVVTSVYILKLDVSSSSSFAPHVQHEHSGSSKAWREVTSLCEELLEDLRNQWFGEDDADIVCVGYGGCICISAGVNLILVYDVGTEVWSKVPTCSQLFELGVNFSAEPVHFPIELRLKSPV